MGLNAIIGTVAGGQKDKQSTSNQTSQISTVNLRNFDDLNTGRSGLEALGYDTQNAQFQDLIKLLQSGPGQNEVQAGTDFQNSFANQLQQLLGQSLAPSSADLTNNFNEAKQLFAPQQEALNQTFQDQNIASNRLAARLGRAGNDPILRNKLMQEQSRQQGSLNAEIGAYGRQLPQIKAQGAMDIGGALSNLRGGLATQALQNRQTLLSMGTQLANSERNYRLQAAGRTTSGYGLTEAISGGGFKGAATGYQAGHAQDMQEVSQMGGMAMSMFSDSRLKTNITPLNPRFARHFLDELTPYSFEYKSQPGQVVGIMAQDLEKSEIGRTMVRDSGAGKVVDFAPAISALLATVAHLNERIKELESK